MPLVAFGAFFEDMMNIVVKYEGQLIDLSVGVHLHITPKKAQEKTDDRVLVKRGDIHNIIFADVQSFGVEADDLIENIFGRREKILLDAFSGHSVKYMVDFFFMRSGVTDQVF